MFITDFKKLKEHDVYEFCYSYHFNSLNDVRHWNKNSIYIKDENFYKISSYIDYYISDFPYFGPAFKMNLDLWTKIKTLAFKESTDDLFINEFFYFIDIWINNSNLSFDFFWIIGL